jgi:hypothetical protein
MAAGFFAPVQSAELSRQKAALRCGANEQRVTAARKQGKAGD